MDTKPFFEPKHFSRTDIMRELLRVQKELDELEKQVKASNLIMSLAMVSRVRSALEVLLKRV